MASLFHPVLQAIGHALRPVRPGPIMLASSRWSGFLPFAIRVSSPAFADGGAMPVRFSMDGEGRLPPLVWDGLPADTQSVALLVEDADVPALRPLVHCIVYGIPPSMTELAEGAVPRRMRGTAPQGWACGRNSLSGLGWLPPSPPPGHGPHRYAFQVFALSARPVFARPPSRSRLLKAIRPHLLAQGRLVGSYERR